MAESWSTARFGCIARDGFRLRPNDRIALTSIDGTPPTRAKTADVRAPIGASFSTFQTYSQFTAFQQWYRYDLAGGSLPFLIDLWLWGQTRSVRARFTNVWQAKREAFDTYNLSCSFEIERESIL